MTIDFLLRSADEYLKYIRTHPEMTAENNNSNDVIVNKKKHN